MGANYGLVFLAWGAAGILGPKLGGRLYDEVHGYTRAFDIAAALLLVACAILFSLHAPNRAANAEPSIAGIKSVPEH